MDPHEFRKKPEETSMSRQTVNDTFSLEIPDSFELLSGEDLGQLSNSGKDPYQWGVRQPEKNGGRQ